MAHFVANGTETLAIPQPDGSYKLHGYKWFSSATDADMTFTLARVIGPDGKIIQVFRLSSLHVHISRIMRKLTIWFPTRSDTNRAVQAQKMARGWNF